MLRKSGNAGATSGRATMEESEGGKEERVWEEEGGEAG